MKNIKKVGEIVMHISSTAILILLLSVAYQFVILPILPALAVSEPGTPALPVVVPSKPETPPKPQISDDILTKLGPRNAVALIAIMVALMALVFWLFIQFGRRLSTRGYLGPLARDAIARAEIARREDSLREDLRYGKMKIEFEADSNQFKERYQIPLEERPPDLTPGVRVDEVGRLLGYEAGWGSKPPGLGGSGITRRPGGYPPLWPDDIGDWTADRLKRELNAVVLADEDTPEIKTTKTEKMISIQMEIDNRFREGYRREQLKAFYKERAKMADDERARAEMLLPTMDVSSFGGGWVFVLEFTTIIFIVFAVLALGLLGVLKSEPIATILAAIAGYVLGKSTSIRGAGGEEIRRGAEEPKVLFEAMTKQEEIRSLRDEEKIKLQREVEDLQRKLAQSKVAVPGLTGLAADEAENKIKERNLVLEKKEVENSGAAAGKVFHQSPEPNSEVSKGSTVVVFIAKNPGTS